VYREPNLKGWEKANVYEGAWAAIAKPLSFSIFYFLFSPKAMLLVKIDPMISITAIFQHRGKHCSQVAAHARDYIDRL